MITNDDRMMRARSHLLQEQPFFGSLAMRLIMLVSSTISTAATDGNYLWYNPKYLDKLSAKEIIFLVAHEVLHCALGHHARRGSRLLRRWNIACDHVINLLLKKAGFDVPSNTYCDARFDGYNAEEVYRILTSEDEEKKQQQQQSPDPDQGEEDDQPDDGGSQPDSDMGEDDADGEPDDGEGGTHPAQPEPQQTCGDPGSWGEVIDAAPAHETAELSEKEDEWQVYTRQAVNIARRQGEGRLPAWIEELVNTLNTPHSDWRETMRRFVEPMTSTKDYSWSRPSVRLMTLGIYLPGQISDGVHHVALCIDSSASVDSAWFPQWAAEVQSVLDDGAVDKVTVMWIDTKVHTDQIREYVKGDTIDFTVYGRGGTRFSPAFEWLNENVSDLSAVIYFTDLECSDYGEEPPYPVLWAVQGSNPAMTQYWISQAPWGQCMELK